MRKLNDVISKAIQDEDFRNSLIADPVRTVESFDLTNEEIAELKTIDFSELNTMNVELEERLSKSFINLPDLAVSAKRTYYDSTGYYEHCQYLDKYGDNGW